MDNRELKFRVWDKNTESFVNNDFNISGQDCGQYFIDLHGDLWQNGLRRLNMGRFLIQQFTGWKDKKGKEIYEGDIVSFSYQEGSSFDNNDRMVKMQGQVYWVNCGFKIGWGYLDIEMLEFANNEDISTNCIVIGNILENSDLIIKQS